MSIVLVIIGLIVGGVLVGQDLIRAAGVRATISQIEKYNQAVNTFRGKYGYLPGDIPNPYATNFGFASRGTYPGEGDGNGVIEDNRYNTAVGNLGTFQGGGEISLFWVDLSAANLIENGFSSGCAVYGCLPDPVTASTTPTLDGLIPEAKLGRGNYVYVYSGGVLAAGSGAAGNGLNYFGFEQMSQYSRANGYATTPNIRVDEAYRIDSKIDDGLPMSGRVTAVYVSNTMRMVGGVPGNPVSASSTTCYDNGNNASNPLQYSLSQNAGADANCALSFQFQ
jgi:hypothetical protein